MSELAIPFLMFTLPVMSTEWISSFENWSLLYWTLLVCPVCCWLVKSCGHGLKGPFRWLGSFDSGQVRDGWPEIECCCDVWWRNSCGLEDWLCCWLEVQFVIMAWQREQREEDELWWLSDCCLGRCMERCTDRGRRAVRKDRELNLWGVLTSPRCREEGLGCEASQGAYSAPRACSPWRLSQCCVMNTVIIIMLN